ncbi:5'/3'-nucleotidase SurE [Candidatus Liberibacter sp.]|uniref:5'/3'-nucleotidase SurE n=1 Tax=Candidatus Liberibacter sp. TaxID=34022 RepID=UPI0015F4447B|nr:5'/3'-nucleotidase SurE [Candidatus Liberibacter sp.]MBA5723809.1 5'/3'-nucleotidase SurE [Candidatus Liberibacter sp.]
MRILLTNDDGIKSEGLLVLEDIAKNFSDDIWVVSPETDQSCLANSLTISRSLSLREVSDKHFALNGTPSDCVIVALHKLCDKKPDLVLSGVNIGTNTANHLVYSGTLAAAFEGNLQGIRSFALSQAYINQHAIPWDVAKTHAPNVLRKLINANISDATLFNINFPCCTPKNVKGIAVTSQEKPCFKIEIKEVSTDPFLTQYCMDFRDVSEKLCKKSDVFAIKNDMISVTPVKTNFTDHDYKEHVSLLLKS